jgi:microcystin-dependent protein
MPLNGTGAASAPPGGTYPASAATLIESAKFNTLVADFLTMFSTAIYKDGQTTTTQRIPFAAGVSTDTVAEQTAAAGVTIDGLLIKDGGLGGSVAFSGDISPTQVAANTNDWAPTGLSASSVIRFSTDARRNITGLSGGSDGRIMILMNSGAFPAVFTYEDSNSSAANRFAFGCTLGGGQVMEIIYDSTSGRWRPKSIPEPIGTIKDFGTSTMPAGFLAIDQNVSRTTYASLYNEIGTTFGAGDGSTTFGLYIGKGATLIAAGTGTQTASGVDADVDLANNTLAVSSNDAKWVTGMAAVFNLTSGTITGLSDDATYYVIRNSSTTIKLASSLANAQAGTAIDLTAKSSPVWDITHTYTARTHGERLGEESHAMSSTEQLAHIHGVTDPGHVHGSTRTDVLNSGGGGALANNNTAASTDSATTGISVNSTGGNAAMNNMQPSTVVTRGIRYC